MFRFCQAAQLSGESVEQFATRLWKMAANCEFHDANNEIKSAIIQNCCSKRLRRFALREDALTLNNLLAKACSLEVWKWMNFKQQGWRRSCPLAISSQMVVSKQSRETGDNTKENHKALSRKVTHTLKLHHNNKTPPPAVAVERPGCTLHSAHAQHKDRSARSAANQTILPRYARHPSTYYRSLSRQSSMNLIQVAVTMSTFTLQARTSQRSSWWMSESTMFR